MSLPVSCVETRFWDKVEKRGASECWTWNGCTEKKGYGRFRENSRKLEFAHRFSYRIMIGPIPTNMCVCHHCDNPPCINPAHLFLGTKSDNNRDRDKKGRHRPLFGEQNGSCKLTRAEVAQIHELHFQGWIQVKLAKKFSVTQQTISNILRGKSRSNHRRLET